MVSAVSLFENGIAVQMATTRKGGSRSSERVCWCAAAVARYVVRAPGSGTAIKLRDFTDAIDQVSSFRAVLMSYVQSFLAPGSPVGGVQRCSLARGALCAMASHDP